MKNLMMVTSAALLVASQAQAEFLRCASSEAASILRNSERNGLPSDVNDPSVLQGFLNGSRVRCARDRDEWVDSCVRTALRTPALLLRPPQTDKDTKPLPFISQIAILPLVVSRQRMSHLPSPLKSPVPTMDQH